MIQTADRSAAAEAKTAPALLSSVEIRALARTFSSTDQPVWIHDLSNRCVYRNRAAEQIEPATDCAASDVLDHANRVIARLTTN